MVLIRGRYNFFVDAISLPIQPNQRLVKVLLEVNEVSLDSEKSRAELLLTPYFVRTPKK